MHGPRERALTAAGVRGALAGTFLALLATWCGVGPFVWWLPLGVAGVWGWSGDRSFCARNPYQCC